MAYKPLSELDKLELESMKRAMMCTPDRGATLTAANLANIEAIRNRGVPVAVTLPATMSLPNSVSLTEYMQQVMSVGG